MSLKFNRTFAASILGAVLAAGLGWSLLNWGFGWALRAKSHEWLLVARGEQQGNGRIGDLAHGYSAAWINKVGQTPRAAEIAPTVSRLTLKWPRST